MPKIWGDEIHWKGREYRFSELSEEEKAQYYKDHQEEIQKRAYEKLKLFHDTKKQQEASRKNPRKTTIIYG